MCNSDESFKDDTKLFEFYRICKKKDLDFKSCWDIKLREWISSNNLKVNSSISIDSPRFPGYTALHFAVKCNNIEAVKILLKRNADATMKNLQGQTSLHLAMEMILSHQSSKENRDLELILDELLTGEKVKSSNPANNSGLTHFHIACFRNNYFTILNFLQRKIEINNFINLDSQHWSGYTPLHIAAKYSLFSSAELLLEFGANVNATNADGLTPLHCAIKAGNRLIVALLFSALNQKIVNPVDRVGLSLLHAHTRINSKCNVFEEFLTNKMNINASVRLDSPIWSGFTPLHMAIHKDSVNKIIILIQHGADINIKDSHNLSPLQLAIHKNLIKPNLMELILWKYNETSLKPVEDIKLFNLFSACMREQVESVKKILNELNVNSIVPLNYPLKLPGYTPLHFAVERGNLEIIELLLKEGADSCAQDANGLSPLHLAAVRKNYNVVKKILSFYSEIAKNPCDENGLSHLHIACMVDKTDIVKNYLDNGINANLATKFGETPLHFAAKFGSKEIAKLLVEYKAETRAINNNGLTPFDLAIENKQEDVAIMLLMLDNGKKITSINKIPLYFIDMKDKINLIKGLSKNDFLKSWVNWTPLHLAIKYNCTKLVKVLLRRGADLTAKDSLNKTPLHYAFKLSTENLKDMLDSIWYAVEAQSKKLMDETGLTLLHIACAIDSHSRIKKSLKRGLNVNSRVHLDCPTWSGYSALHFVARYGSARSAELLLRNNVEIDAVDKNGFTPLHLACARSRGEIVEKLLGGGFDPAAKSSRGITPLRLALQANDDVVVRTILSKSSGIKAANPMDNKGLTYFHVACIKGMHEIVEGFVKNGVDVEEAVHPCAPKYSGCTAVDIALKLRNTRILDLLLKKPQVDAPLGPASSCKNPLESNSLTKRLKAALHSLDDPRNDWMMNALLSSDGDAAFLRNLLLKTRADTKTYAKIFTLLVQHGFDLDGSDDSENEPILLAALKRNFRAFEALLRCGADVEREDAAGSTAISHYFQLGGSSFRQDLCQALRRHLHARTLAGGDFGLSSANEGLYRRLVGEAHRFDEQSDRELCGLEFERMRQFRFAGFASLRDLFADVDKMALHLARNGRLGEFVKSPELDADFPRCAPLIMMQYGRAVRRKDVLLTGIETLDKLMTGSFRLKHWESALSESIAGYLSNEDLRNLGSIFF